MRQPRLFTIPPGAPFLDTLATTLLDGRLVPGFSAAAGPLGLASATIFVPTRRAARALAATLASHIAAPSVLLPRILPLGGLDAVETDVLFDDPGFDDPLTPDLPIAIGDLTRRMIMTRMILGWAQAVRRAIISVDGEGRRTLHANEDLLVATSAADAWALSGDLAALSDELLTEGIHWASIEPLGTDAFDRYWRITLDFLNIAIAGWPAILAERGEVDRAARQIALVDAEIRRLEHTASGPVIVAGSTGSNKATARLIAAISRLPHGAVVLPGLDQSLDEPSWRAIAGLNGADPAASHPQAALKRLLGTIGVERDAVVPLGMVPPTLTMRRRFVSEAMRPAETTDLWRAFADQAEPLDLEAALADVLVIEAADEREEALALAIAMREALEQDGTAVLVTPDRALGRRVREELARWSIEIDESGGEQLGTTPAGAFARLVVDCALSDLAPVEVLALLAHPLARFGRARHAVADLARTLEIAILRGVLPPRALHDPAGLVERARAKRQQPYAPDPLKRLDEAAFDRLAAFLADVTAALAPVHRLGAGTPLPDWLDAHAEAIWTMTLTPDGETAMTGIDGHAVAALFDALREAADAAITLDGAGYAALFDRFAAETPVRGPNRSHPRLKILGLLEARLLSADLVLLAGLDETIWPPLVQTDAFLNRPMRAALGLPPPERRIGQTAHDLDMALGQPRVILSRARKRGGAPTVPSRFLQRMAAVAGPHWAPCRQRGSRYVALAAALDRPAESQTLKRPAPRPDVALRPTRLSVTRIETLRRDPYAIYAESILKLRPVDPIGAIMGPREYGTDFHAVLRDFTRHYAEGPLPPGAADDLLGRAETIFEGSLDEPLFRSFLWPRIAGWTRAFVAWEAGRRARAAQLAVEERGELLIPLSDGSVFKLTANADRIETGPDGLVTIIDYKTGASPSLSAVKVGFAPQLTLEAAMVERGAFPTIGEGRRVEGATYVKFGTSDSVELRALTWKDRSFEDVVADHFEGLVQMLDSFRDPATGYPARPYPQFAARFNAYDHLSRVKEWSAAGGDDGGEDAA
ncbi:double-strand break repair protein AddB [Lichenihabitans psoromatis]|uniref:double-strand break repair protein AddB n=1 Tax=Lichenihabitans psoromatis TaxID=2528642 RepID=UPI0010385D2B|nr:double-strand break repair protein AddB [Lichenihabitans psoromatis]